MVGTVSASNATDELAFNDNQDFSDVDLNMANTVSDEISIQNKGNVLSVNTQSKDLLGENSTSSKENTKSSDNAKSQIIKTTVKCKDYDANPYKKSKVFKIKIIDKNTKKPIKNLKLSLKIENKFFKDKTYTLKTNNNGIAKFNLKNLKMGRNFLKITSKNSNYEVEAESCVDAGKLKKPVTIKIKSQLKFKNGDTLSAFQVKKFDGMFRKGVYVFEDVDNSQITVYKVKFYFKNNNGDVITKTGYFTYHKLIKGYTPYKVKVWYLECPTKTIVKEKSSLIQYKSNYKLQILDFSTKKPIKNVKVNFKIKDNNKYKNYILKTDKKGFIKFKTKNLKLGFHKLAVSSKDKNYMIYFKSNIFVGKLKKSTYLKNDESLEFENGDFIYASLKNKVKVFSQNQDDYGNKLKAKTHFVFKVKIFFKNNNDNNLISTKIIKNDYTIKSNSIKGYTPFKVQVWYLQA